MVEKAQRSFYKDKIEETKFNLLQRNYETLWRGWAPDQEKKLATVSLHIADEICLTFDKFQVTNYYNKFFLPSLPLTWWQNCHASQMVFII